MVARDGERPGVRAVTASVCISLGGSKNVLELDSEDGRTIL